MSWVNIKELLFQERKCFDVSAALSFPQENVFETQQSALLGCYLRTKPAVDRAASTFAETLDWPELTPVEKFFVAARLEFAWEVASILNTTHREDPLVCYPSPERCTTTELLEWLLIDIWPYGCNRFLQARKRVVESSTSAERREPRFASDVDRASVA